MHYWDVLNEEQLKTIGFAIKDFENKTYQKEEMLNCVMYRIIERGGNRIGPRRAFLFAKEFGRNIDIPMIYGVDSSEPGLRNFMNEYINSFEKNSASKIAKIIYDENK